MSPNGLLRALTPLGWLAVAAVFLALGSALLGGLGFRWDPLGLERRRLAAAQVAAAGAEAERDARRFETAGAGDQLRRAEIQQTQAAAARGGAAVLIEQARKADDADILLEARRADRLRGHDRELCRLAPDLDGCAAAPAPAGGGDKALRPGGPPGRSDDG